MVLPSNNLVLSGHKLVLRGNKLALPGKKFVLPVKKLVLSGHKLEVPGNKLPLQLSFLSECEQCIKLSLLKTSEYCLNNFMVPKIMKNRRAWCLSSQSSYLFPAVQVFCIAQEYKSAADCYLLDSSLSTYLSATFAGCFFVVVITIQHLL